ncbi:MAG: ABC transporter permease [Acidimicrobiales bacterium]
MTRLHDDEAALGGIAGGSTGAMVEESMHREQPRSHTLAKTLLPPLVLGIVLIGFWYFISYVILDPARRFLLRPPHEVLTVGFLDWDNFSEILEKTWVTTQISLKGLAIAILIGSSLATAMSQSKYIERALFPYMVTLQAIPILAIVPLIGFWFGFGDTSRLTVVVLIALFPIIVNTLFGLQSTERGLHDLLTLHGASRSTRLRKLMFPGALPAIFAGLRISAGLSVIGAIVGDFFFAQGQTGLGQLLRRFAVRLDGEQLIAAIIMSSALGVSVFWIFGIIQQRAIGRWYDTGGEAT